MTVPVFTVSDVRSFRARCYVADSARFGLPLRKPEDIDDLMIRNAPRLGLRRASVDPPRSLKVVVGILKGGRFGKGFVKLSPVFLRSCPSCTFSLNAASPWPVRRA